MFLIGIRLNISYFIIATGTTLSNFFGYLMLTGSVLLRIFIRRHCYCERMPLFLAGSAAQNFFRMGRKGEDAYA